MKSYIYYKLSCSHPLVKRIWQTGGFAPMATKETPIMICNTHLEFNDDSRKDFFDDIDCKKADEYLLSLDNAKSPHKGGD